MVSARQGLVHVSQNMPTRSALAVKMVRPEGVQIQVSGKFWGDRY